MHATSHAVNCSSFIFKFGGKKVWFRMITTGGLNVHLCLKLYIQCIVIKVGRSAQGDMLLKSK